MSALLMLSLIFVVNAYFLWWVWRGLFKLDAQLKVANDKLRKYSVIIAAHNEEAVIANCLTTLVAQNYPKDHYEIIIAADRCNDETVEISRAFQSKFSALQILEIADAPPNVSPKKNALAQAIQRAKFDHFLFLDADVRPSLNHIRTLNGYFDDDAAAVISLMRFAEATSFWQRFLVFEKLASWCIAAAGVGWRCPIISYGGNWGYTRGAFQKANGFDAILHSLSGDDDLLLQKMGQLNLPVRFCLHPDGWVKMDAPSSFSQFFRQRRRHFSAGKKYLFSLQLSYFLYHASNLALWIAPLFFPPAGIFLLLKLTLDWRIIRRGSRLFREHFPPVSTLIFDFLFMIYNTLVGPLGHVGRIRW